MKTTINLLFILVFSLGFAQAQTTKTVGGASPNYATLQLAFAAINSGAIQGQIVLQITGSTTESFLPQLNASGTGNSNYTSVLIYPTGAFTISTALNSAVIDLNGADNVTIDGRIDGTGTPNSLTIIGTSTGNGAAGIRFVNSAENNTIKNCNIQACSASSSMGIVAFGGSSAGNGNDNNIVENCNLTNSGTNRPYNGIVSSGSTGRENNGGIIRNNNIYNTFQTGVSSNGISISTNSVGFTISGNSIYETTAFVTSTGSALTYYGIYVISTSEHTISGNFIGGKATMCGGDPWSFAAGNATYFCGIYAYAGNTATTIANNTIKNINYSSKEDNPWDGIFLYSGNFEVSGNTIGATTGTGSITLTSPVPVATTTLSSNPGGISNTITVLNGGSGYTTAPIVTFTNPPSGGTVPTATANLTGGAVTSITVNTPGSGYTTAPAVIFDGQSNNYSTSHGMIQNSTGTVNITGNNIGSITTVGSNYYSHGFESVYVRTIAATTTLTNNLIGSLDTPNSIHVSSTAVSSLIKQDVYGLYSASTGTTTISGNTVANLTNAYTGTNGQTRTRGIQTTAGINIITNNTVFNIKSASLQTGGGSTVSVTGISQTSTTGATQTVNGNTIYNLSSTSLSAKVQLFGMYYAGPSSGTNSVSGNFVHSLSASSSDIGAVINGIFINSGLVTCANNIINLGVDLTKGYLINGMWDGTSSGNNVGFYFNTVYIGGSVSSGATSNTAGLWNANNTSTRNYRNNIFYNARTGGTTGMHYAIRVAGTTGLTIGYNDYLGPLSGITLNTAPDNNSVTSNPGFTLAGGTSAINYSTSATLNGVSGTGTTTDYYGITRNATTPKMGALEQTGNVWQGGTSTDFNTASNWTNNAVPASSADIIFATSPIYDCVLDANRMVGSITNGSSKNLLVNGKTLTVNGSLSFTSSGKINTSTASSVVKFAGSTSQTIPSAAFVSNTVAGLTIANSNGVALNGDLTVSAALTITSGVLNVGANTFTYSGISPTSEGGTVDASNASAELVFANASAITLPATFFTGAVNNLTISGSDGVTAGSDITVNGVLNLAAANPSATKGLLEMTKSYTNYPGTSNSVYLDSWLLNMGANASTIGTGDVTGTVKRGTILENTPYTFGHQYTTIMLTTGTMPTAVSVTITIGNTPPGDDTPTPGADVYIRDAYKRTYEIVPTVPVDYSSTSRVSANFHYLDNELASSLSPNYVNTEAKTVTWDYDIGGGIAADEHGRSNYDFSNNYIGLTNVPIDYFINKTGHAWRTIFTMRDYRESHKTWTGSESTGWSVENNWTPAGLVGEGTHVIIPNSASTPNDPILPNGVTINTLTIENGGILNMGGETLTIKNSFSGGWEDQNPLGNDPGTSKVIFSMPGSTISGTGRFYDVEIGTTAEITNQAGSTMKIENSITKTGTGKWYADVFDNTIEYNKAGNQTILLTDGTSTYWNLILNGSGTKTLPASAMSLERNLTLAGTATATAAGALTIGGNLLTEAGATFNAGAFSHAIAGDIYCDGAITAPSGGTLTCTGNFYNTSSYTGASGSTLSCGNFENSSAGIFSGTGSTLTFNGTFTNDNSFDGTNSTITCKGNFTNNGNFTGTGSTVTLNGTAVQLVQGTSATTFNHLTSDNSAGVILMSDDLTTVSGTLTINTGKKFEISAGKQLTVSGTISNSGGTSGLILRSESDVATGTASLINSTAGVYATAERWMTGDIWHLISPTAIGQTAAEFIGDAGNGIASNANNYGLSPYLEGNNEWDYFKVAGISGNLDTPAKGYQVLRATGTGTGNGTAGGEGIVSFKGTLAAGDKTIPVTRTSYGWNLVGNPYPCALDVELFLANTENMAAIDPSFLSIYVADVTNFGYTAINASNGANDLKLATGEAFFVKSKTGGGTVNFTTAMKSHTSDAFKSAVIQNGFNLVAESAGNKMSTSVKYIPQMTAGLDPGWDAGLFYNGKASPLSLFTRLVEDNSVDFTIQCLPDFDYENLVVPVGIKAKQGAKVIFSLADLTVPVGYRVFLEDKVSRKFTRLDEQGSSYSVQINTASNEAGRFFLHTKQEITGIKDGLSNHIVVIPLPQHNIIRVSGLVNLPAKATVYDMNGRMIAIKKLTSLNENEIPLNGVSNGIYLIKINSDKQTTQSKFSWSL